MVTLREARQRLSLAHMRLYRLGREFKVTFADLPPDLAERKAYITDDLEDAMLTGLLMRRPRDRKFA
jgi:hypothetical protein